MNTANTSPLQVKNNLDIISQDETQITNTVTTPSKSTFCDIAKGITIDPIEKNSSDVKNANIEEQNVNSDIDSTSPPIIILRVGRIGGNFTTSVLNRISQNQTPIWGYNRLTCAGRESSSLHLHGKVQQIINVFASVNHIS